MLVYSLSKFSHEIDQNAKASSRKMVTRALDSWSDDIVGKLNPQTYWDDAVINLDNRFDPAWARMMIGDYLIKTQEMDLALVFDRNDKLIMAQGRDELREPERRQIEKAAAPLLTSIRNAERLRGPLPKNQADDFRIPAISADGIVRIGDRAYLLAASLVQPDRFAAPSSARSAIVMAGSHFDPAAVDGMAKRYLFDGVTFSTSTKPSGPLRETMVLHDPIGEIVGMVEWTPRAPGQTLLNKTWPIVLIFCVLIGIAILAVTLRARRLTESLIASEARAKHLAFHDSLTGLPNRARLSESFATVAKQARASGTGFAMLCIDLDRFKAVNDSLGHLAGDALIKVIAGRITSVCRPSDEIIRFGGDEFLVLQAGAAREETDALAARLIRTIAEPVQINGDRVFVGASIGVVSCSEEMESANECLRRADLALYEAKEAGRNCWRHFMPAMDRQLRDRETMRVRLHDALLSGAIQMHYQPQVDATGDIIGLEALARWNDNDKRAVPPSSFVQVAEETGLIDTLGFYAMRQAFEDSRRWPGMKIAINVSAVQLRSRNFVEDVANLVDQVGVNPSQFELEITERLLLADDSHTLAILKALRSLGFRIALDDFGTGYSSLGYLQRYPIDCIKIDRSFILRIDRDPQAQSVVLAIVQLAKALDLDVIAEGVENEAQRDCLKAAGCNDMQGFLIGRPVAADKVTEHLQRRLAV